MNLDADFARSFASQVRNQIALAEYSAGIDRLRSSIGVLADAALRQGADSLLSNVANFAFITLEDSQGNRSYVAAEVDRIAGLLERG